MLITGCLANYENDSKTTESVAPELRHIVLFKFNEDADPAAVKKAEDAFLALPGKIPEIKAFEWGLNNSPERLDKGFTHSYFLTFASEEDRAVYLPHPDHKAFGALLDGILADVLVFDYWANR
ncbi:stress responsive alpha-beta barrel domain-containing protein [Roseivirga misakiensis]|uniref:Stress responsive alpha-beta barrel domain-containing protein n=1 Tax=Roseivirga misakiensis TaxID=1563681 RepID=A0A1E5T2M4_9BACT|nr:stress responsive alpha-beta barrel domain-containing protein [Roseivirga misakiensis]